MTIATCGIRSPRCAAWLSDEPIIIERGEGNYLIDVNGRRYLDGVASLWCNVHGHRKAAARRRAAQRSSIRSRIRRCWGWQTCPAIELGRESWSSIAPPGLTRVFYSDSGAEAVEVALRMAAQYWQLSGSPAPKVAFCR